MAHIYIYMDGGEDSEWKTSPKRSEPLSAAEMDLSLYWSECED